MVLLAGALSGEIEPFLNRLEGTEEHSWGNYCFHTGMFSGKEILLAETGTGKVQTAVVLQHLIDIFPVKKMIYTGIAGALNPVYHAGDIVVCRDCLQFDVDASLFGFIPGEIPGTGIYKLSPDFKMAEAAGKFKPKGYRIHFGRILTGDRFIESTEERERLNREFQGDLVEMEGAAAAMTAFLNRIPWLIIRTVSDQTDGKLPRRYKNFLSRVSVRNIELIEYIFTELQSAEMD